MVNDREILDYFIDTKRNAIISARINRVNLAKNTPQYKEYLEKRYEDFRGNYCETIYRIYYNLDSIPCCKNCGKKLKYHGFKENSYGVWCSTKCQLSDKDFIKERESSYTEEEKKKRKEKAKKTLFEKYGDEFYHNKEKAKETCLKRYGSETPLNRDSSVRKKWEGENLKKYGKRVLTNPDKIAETKLVKYGDAKFCNREKARKTMIERYGVKATLQSNELFDKVKKTKLERYGDSHYINRDKVRKTMIERYGVENPYQIQSIRDRIDYSKIIETKKKNHTFNSSKEEDKMYELLKTIYPYYTIIRSYEDERYKNPDNGNKFVCDFYIKELDLFIELNGHYTHGKHPFDENNEKDIALLNEYKNKTAQSYKIIAEVWGRRDVLKRSVAKQNNLNYLVIYGKCPSKETVIEKVYNFINK